LPLAPVPVDIAAATRREVRIETMFRYAHQYDRTVALMASGKVDLKPLISETFPFADAIAAFDRAWGAPDGCQESVQPALNPWPIASDCIKPLAAALGAD
jgi:D-xylulose reductase